VRKMSRQRKVSTQESASIHPPRPPVRPSSASGPWYDGESELSTVENYKYSCGAVRVKVSQGA